MHEYFYCQDPLRILNFLRLQRPKELDWKGILLNITHKFASNSIVWIKTFQSYYNLQMEGQTVAATPKIYDWWPHYFKK